MSPDNILETHSWKEAIKVFFNQAAKHKDICMMRALIDELQGVAAVVTDLEHCLKVKS